MKNLLRSRLLRFLPGILLRLSSVWLLASFATAYYGRFDAAHHCNLLWPALFFSSSLLFSILLFYWGERQSGAKTNKARLESD